MAKKRRKTLARAGGIYLILVLFLLYLPSFVMVAYSFNEHKDGLVWTGFTTKWYTEVWKNRQITEAMKNSLIVALASCLIAAVVGTLGAVALSRRKLKRDGILEMVSSVPIMLPEIVLGLAFMVTFSMLGIGRGLHTLILAHATFCIPYVMILVSTRLKALPAAYEEAARDLGASPIKVLFTITVPLVMPAILSGVFLAFAMSLDDFIISFFVKGAESTTYPVYVYGRVKTTVPPTVNVMCTVMLGATLIAVALSQLFMGKKTNNKEG